MLEKKLSKKIAFPIMIVVLFSVLITFYYFTQPYLFYNIDNPETTVVINPIFTSSAYQKNGFYYYYAGKCDQKCLTIDLNFTESFVSSKNALQVFRAKNYQIITDLDLHNNVGIIKQYEKVILLHNEYVTKEEFNAITSHPHVVYLYPNALYAEVEYAYGKLTLIRGHNYPQTNILNGFDWKYDNSKLEYDRDCKSWKFYPIKNGHMLNCYPERTIQKNIELLLALGRL